MAHARQGDTVKVHYTGKLDDGQVFDSSLDREPLEFTLGDGEIIPGFEEAVVGMEPGQKKTATIGPDKAYGPHIEEMVQVVDRQEFPDTIEPHVGQHLRMQTPDDQVLIVRVVDVTDASVTLDGNHPLAGQELTFDIELLEIAA